MICASRWILLCKRHTQTRRGGECRAIRYRADFTYRERDGRLVVEDVKSKPTRTREYLIKRKLMKERRGIDITEV